MKNLQSQSFLDLYAQNDSFGFLQNVSNWNNHRPLLFLSLNLTKVGENTISEKLIPYSVLELGMGDGSSVYLSKYCKSVNSTLCSFDNNAEWAAKFEYLLYSSNLHNIVSINDESQIDVWVDSIKGNKYSTILVDHASGERRHKDIERLKDSCDFMVIHDSESAATGYSLDKIWHLFKYRLNLNSGGACAALVSNTFDVTIFDGCNFGGHLLEKAIV